MSRLLYRLSYAAICRLLYWKNRRSATAWLPPGFGIGASGFDRNFYQRLEAPPPPERPPPNEPECEREELPDDELGEESRAVPCARVLL